MRSKLKKHYINNFKAFSSPQEVSIKPITLIFGANNAGKSSLLKSLMYLKHLNQFRLADLDEVKEKSEIVDYGGKHQILNSNSINGKISFTQEFELSNLLIRNLSEVFEGLNDSDSLFSGIKGIAKLSIEIDLLNFDKPYITFWDLSFKNVELDIKRLNKQEKIDKVEINFPRDHQIKLSQRNETEPYIQIDEITKSVVPLLKLLGLDFKNIDYLNIDYLRNENVEDLKLIFEGAKVSYKVEHSIAGTSILLDNIKNPHGEYVKGWNASIKSKLLKLIDIFSNLICKVFDEFYPRRSFTYLGPLRKMPKRIINTRNPEEEEWYSILEDDFEFEDYETGELTTERERLNDLLTASDKMNLDHEFVKETFKSDLDDRRVVTNLALRNTKNGHISSLKDVGTGLSQLLPIVVELITGFGSHDIIVEQPELHLHPGLQSKFGRLLSYTFKPNRNIIMETHSEHIIKSLQLEVTKYHATEGEEGISKDDIAILYVSNENGEASIREMKLDDAGSFTEPWPDDFFESSADLTYERLKMMRNNLN